MLNTLRGQARPKYALHNTSIVIKLERAWYAMTHERERDGVCGQGD